MASNDGSLVEPLHDPFQQLTSNNRGPILMATGITLIILTALTILTKFWMRYANTGGLGISDLATLGAFSFAVGHLACISVAVHNGLGRHESTLGKSDLITLSKAYYASNILLIISLAAAKASVALLIMSIDPVRLVRYGCHALLVLIGSWMIASAVALALQCQPIRWAIGPGNGQICLNQYALQVSIRALDIFTDLMLILLPVIMMWPVHTGLLKKWVVVLLFATRIATPIITAASIVSLGSFYHSVPQDRPWEAITPAVWTTVALNISIVTACIPSIKRFLAYWATGLSNANIPEPLELEYTTGKKTPNSYYASGSSISNKIATKLGLSSNARVEVTALSTTTDEQDAKGGRSRVGGLKEQTPEPDTSESVRGLTDGVIMHTMDYKVEFEERDPDHQDRSPASSMSRPP